MHRKIRAACLVVLLVVIVGSLPVRAGGGGGRHIGVIFAGLANGKNTGAVYRSIDDGATWQRTKHDPGTSEVSTIAIGGGLVYAGSYDGLYRSADGGDSWQRVYREAVMGFVLDPLRSRNLYVVELGGTLGSFRLSRSTDAGTTWSTSDVPGSKYLDGLPLGLSIDPGQPSTLVVRLFASDSKDILVSTDGGYVWQSASGLPRTITPGEGYYVNAVTYDPTNPLLAYAATDKALYRSTDGGLTWHEGGLRHQLLAVIIDPTNPKRLVVGGRSGSFYSPDGGNHWVRTISAASTEDTDLRAMAFDVAKPATLVGAINFLMAPLQISYDAGLHWQTIPKPFPMPQASFVECLASGWL